MNRTKKTKRPYKPPASSRLAVAEQERRLQAYVTEHWLTLAAVAWQCYSLHGRGYLFFDTIPPTQPNQPYYNRAAVIAETLTEDVPELIDMLATYDPEQAIIVVVADHTINGPVYVQLQANDPPPPEAYIRSMTEYN